MTSEVICYDVLQVRAKLTRKAKEWKSYLHAGGWHNLPPHHLDQWPQLDPPNFIHNHREIFLYIWKWGWFLPWMLNIFFLQSCFKVKVVLIAPQNSFIWEDESTKILQFSVGTCTFCMKRQGKLVCKQCVLWNHGVFFLIWWKE